MRLLLNSAPPANKLTGNRQVIVLSAPMNLLRSGFAALQYEIAEERASALARLGQRLEDALTALAACPRTADTDRTIRNRLVEQAGYALWLFVVQREAVGLHKIDHVIQIYRVPNEVIARMGPLASTHDREAHHPGMKQRQVGIMPPLLS